MRHLNDGTLVGYRDDQLTDGERRTAEEHLTACPACRERLDRLVSDADQVSRALKTLGPGSLDQPNAGRALARLQISVGRRQETPMIEKIKTDKRYQRALAGVLALVVLVGLFSLAPVRALASQFLGIFRVEKFVVVDVDEERLEEISEAISEDFYFGEYEFLEEPGEPVEVASLDEAEALVGFKPRTPAGYDDPATIVVTGQAQMRFTPDLEDLRTVFATLGLDPALLPDNIDGQNFDFTLPAGVAQAFALEDEEGIDFAIMQVPSPTADVPEDVDMQALGEAMLQLLGMTPEEAAQLSENIDWATTLVLPIPTGLLQTVQEIGVDGVTGLLFEMQGYETDDGTYLRRRALLWQKDGIVYMLTSEHGSTERLVSIANTLE